MISFAALSSLFSTILEATISASILVLLVLAIQLTVGRRLSPAWRYLLWMPVLVRLLVPVFPESSLSVFNAVRWGGGVEERAAEIAEPIEFALADEAAETASGFQGLRHFSEPLAAEWTAATAEREFPFWSLAAAVWFVVASLLLLRLGLGSIWLTLRLRRDGRAAPDELEQVLTETAKELGSRIRPRLRETSMVESPALFGLFRPVLLVPREFSRRLDQGEMRHVFLHELAHLKRGDWLVNWLMAVAQALHWFNPLAWVAFRQMRIERELACDEIALRAASSDDPSAYGRTILRLLDGVTARHRLPAVVGIAEEKHAAKRRLRQIARFQPGHRRYWLALPILLAIAVAGLTNAQAPRTINNEPVLNPPAEEPADSVETAASVTPDPGSHASTLVNDARLLMEMGELDEAEAKLNEALKKDPEHRVAIYYRALLEERRSRPASNQKAAEPRVLLPSLPPAMPRDRTAELDQDRNSSPAQQARRSAIARKLDQIVMDQYHIPEGSKLSEVIKDLDTEVRRRDPDRKGVNFVISSFIDRPGSQPLGRSPGGFPGGGIDPLTGQPSAGPGGTRRPTIIEDILVKIDPPLNHVRLVDILDVLVKVAKPPPGQDQSVRLKYSIEDYGVVFSQRNVEPEQLHTRTWRLDSNTFLQRVMAGLGENQQDFDSVSTDPPKIQNSVREFFLMVGLDFLTNQVQRMQGQFGPGSTPPQKAIFFNDRTGVLFVRATLPELDIVESVLHGLNAQPPQIRLRIQLLAFKAPEDRAAFLFVLANEPGIRRVLPAKEFARLLPILQRVDGFEIHSSQITTISGRAARIELEGKIVEVVPKLYPVGERLNKLGVQFSLFDMPPEDAKPRFTQTLDGENGETFVFGSVPEEIPMSPKLQGTGPLFLITAEAVHGPVTRVNLKGQD